MTGPTGLRAAVVVAVLAVGGVAGLVAPSVAQASIAVPSTLTAGQALTAGTVHDTVTSANGRFVLQVTSKMVSMTEWVPAAHGGSTSSVSVWSRYDASQRDIGGNDATTLRVGKDGNVSLRTAKGHTLWSTHTARSGAHDRLHLSNAGGLRLSTAGGKSVWSSHTSSIVRGPGERLASGASLTLQPGWGDTPARVHTLSMRRGGELVLTCGSHVGWRSHTHTRGSYLVMQTNGRLVIRTPKGRAVWATHATTRNPQVFFFLVFPDVEVPGGRTLWLMQTDDRYC